MLIRPYANPHRRRAPSRARLGTLALAAVTMVACGSAAADDPADPAEASTDPTAASDTTGADDTSAVTGDPMLDFFQCLRDGGLDVQDPDPGGPIDLGVDVGDPEVQALVDNCRETHLGDTDGRVTSGEGTMGDNMASSGSLLAYVDCMREQGVDMPDPTADGRLQMPEGADRNDPALREAGQECAEHLDGGIMVGEPGGSGGGAVIMGDQ